MADSLLFEIMVYLAAAILVVPLAQRLGLGSVLGYLLAGILIGPYVLDFIGERGEDLLHFAEFGVVMMLFLIGLELQPALLWRLRTPILGMGGAQVVLSTLLLGGLALAFGLAWNQALAVGMTFALSSTAIVLSTLAEKGLMESAGGRGSFAILLFQDIAVIPMLALLPLLVGHGAEEAVGAAAGAGHGHGDAGHGGGNFMAELPALVQALITLGAVLLVVLVGRYVMPRLMRTVARTRQRELLTGAALLLVVAVAVLMTFVGLSPALGAFVGGVVLATSPYRHELESDLMPFKGLLLGLFFMAVGASIDFGLILERPLLIALLVVILLLVKGLILFGIGRAFRLSLDQNFLLSFGLAQTGEFAFVLLAFIQGEGILPVETVALLLVVVAVSMALTPLLMLFNERVLQPRLGTRARAEERPPDAIEERRRVIVAGFGRFGAVAGRFLGANGVRATILDNDSDRVELLRRMGFEVYYGDATRVDLLETAGAAEAEAIIIGLHSSEQNLRLVETVQQHFPHLEMIVRSFDYADTYELMEAGVEHIHRDVLHNAVDAAGRTLKLLGFRAYQVERHTRRFLQHDAAQLATLAAIRNDPDRYADTIRNAVSDLENQLRSDLSPDSYNRDAGWDATSLVNEFGGEREG
ncbi:MAG: monovalent cation:proton antiporter-2 (CPA2) family protein [Bacteroidota bacterium]